jgi:F-type H+-transporting ATPase subunit delta
MRADRLSDRYARALAKAAQRGGVFDEVAGDMELLKQVLAGAGNLLERLAAPRFTPTRRIAIVGRVFEGRIQPLTLHFLITLFRRGRHHLLRDIPAAFEAETDARRGIVAAQLSSARPMEPSQHRRVADGLQKRSGRSVRLQTSVAPSLLGGFRIILDGTLIDRSIAGALARMREQVSVRSRAQLLKNWRETNGETTN